MKINLHESRKHEKGTKYKITSIRIPLDVARGVEVRGIKGGSRSPTDTINQILAQFVAGTGAPKGVKPVWAAHADESARKDYGRKKVVKAKVKAKAPAKKVKAKAKTTKVWVTTADRAGRTSVKKVVRKVKTEPTPKLNPLTKRMAKIRKAIAKAKAPKAAKPKKINAKALPSKGEAPSVEATTPATPPVPESANGSAEATA